MASSVATYDVSEPAHKRRKLSSTSLESPSRNAANSSLNDGLKALQSFDIKAIMDLQIQREREAGIVEFVNPKQSGFAAILKQRYTDFLVNEIGPDGHVLHLTTYDLPSVMRDETGSQDAVKSDKGSLESTNQAEETAEKSDPKAEGDQLIAKAGLSQGKAEIENDQTEKLAPEDRLRLDSYIGSSTTAKVIEIYEKTLKDPHARAVSFGFVRTEPIADKDIRTKIHQDVRRLFNNVFETTLQEDGSIEITVGPRNRSQKAKNPNANRKWNQNNELKGKLGWQQLGGEHLHFTLYKENKDTMEVIGFLAGKLRLKSRDFSFAGTKDRRGVSVQRVSVRRVHADRVRAHNRDLWNAKVGNFKYEKHRLELGELLGNEFVITLRDCRFDESERRENESDLQLASRVMEDAVNHLQEHGFINYFGLQRFGTYANGTHETGKFILQGDFKAAVDSIMSSTDEVRSAALDPNISSSHERALGRDDIARVQAIDMFQTTGKAGPALEKLPRRFGAEAALMRHLARNGQANDHLGALLQISRNLRLMYIHAYQSFVWNKVASHRWARFGNQVVEGDLVLIDSNENKKAGTSQNDQVDQNGEVVIDPAADDSAASRDDQFQRARPLTASEAQSGDYTVFDVVLPTPGFDINYPANEMGEFYKEFMGSEEGGKLDPSDMRRAQRDFSLSGSYRKFLARTGSKISFEVKSYTDPAEQFVQTDLEVLSKTAEEEVPKKQQNASSNAGKRETFTEKHERLASSQHLAWKNLPEKIAADDKAAFEAEEARKKENVDPSSLVHPTYKDTFIETSAESGRRTGHRETNIHAGTEGLAQTVALEKIDESLKDQPSTGSTSELPEKESAVSATNEEITATVQNVQKPVSGEEQPVSEEKQSINAEKQVTKEESAYSGQPALNGNKRPAEDSSKDNDPNSAKIAIIVKFQLGASQYATMALRELMKQGGVQEYKTEYFGSR